METQHNPSQDVKEFMQDLDGIKSQAMSKSKVYPDLPLEGKRKCLEDLEDTIRTLQKIKKDLKEAADHSPDKNVVQVLWKGPASLTFTRQDVIHSFAAISLPVQVVSVEFQDNFTLDQNKYLQPLRMCFIKFVAEEDAATALGFQKMHLHVKLDSSSSLFPVEFILPTHSMATYKTLRIIGNSIARLGEIDKELKKIGAVRRHGGMPELGPGFIDKGWYLTKLQEFKRIRAAGGSLDLHSHTPLAGMKPVDSNALKLRIKTLYDEECDILIQLREFQLNGVEFNFNHLSLT